MTTKPTVRKRRIEKLLARSGGGTKWTNRLDELPHSARNEIRSRIELGDKEEFILSSYSGKGEWCALTTERLIWLTSGHLDGRPWEEVYGIQIPPGMVKAVVLEEAEKHSLENLEVFDQNEQRYIIRPESGKGYFIVLDAIASLCSSRRKPDWPEFFLVNKEQ